MGKKIIIATMLVLTLLLLMPSIPAIHQKIIEDKVIDDFVKQPDDEIKYPNLYHFVCRIIERRAERGYFLMGIGMNMWGDVEFRIIYNRGMSLWYSALYLRKIWMSISDRLEWNWEIPIVW